MAKNKIQYIETTYEDEDYVSFRIKVIPGQKYIKPKYYQWGYYKNDDISRQRYGNKIHRLLRLDYSKKPRHLYIGIDAKGRIMTLTKLGYNSKWCGQYAVRFRSTAGYIERWQLVGRYKELNDALDTFHRRGYKI